jgi:hypothetical protein
MAGKVSKPVNGVVKVNPGNTVSQIAKANNLTTKQVLDLNPALKSNPKYNKGNTIFSGTNIRVAPKTKALETPLQTKTTIIDGGTSGGGDSGGFSGGGDISPTPPTPQKNMILSTPPPPPVKTASIDTVLFDDETMPIDIMSDLIFEDIGGQELINIARNDIVNGQTISYQPIKNLSSLQQQYNPNNILSLQQTSDKYFANFSIKLDERIPTTGSGPNGEYVYLEEGTGDLIIELVNMPSSEQVDVEITLDGTIYQAVL